MKKIDVDKLLKWIPVVAAGVVAVYQALGEQKEEERIEEIENRITELEENNREA